MALTIHIWQYASSGLSSLGSVSEETLGKDPGVVVRHEVTSYFNVTQLAQVCVYASLTQHSTQCIHTDFICLMSLNYSLNYLKNASHIRVIFCRHFSKYLVTPFH